MNDIKKRNWCFCFSWVGIILFICAFWSGVNNHTTIALICLAISIPLSMSCFAGYVSADRKIEMDKFVLSERKRYDDLSESFKKMSDVDLIEKIKSSKTPSDFENVLALVESFNRWRKTL